MNDRSENNLSMAHAVNNYLGTPAAALLVANATVTARKATLVTDLGAVATLLGTQTLLGSESVGATAAKKLTRTEFNRLMLKTSSGLVSAFTSTGDTENATAVRLTKTKIARARDQNLTPLVTLLTTKAALVTAILTAHNVSSAELGQLTTAAAGWGGTSSKNTAKKAGSNTNLQAAGAKVENIVKFLKEQFDPLITTFLLSTTEAERIAAAGYFTARTVIDLHGPGAPEDPAPPVPPVPPTP